jgi:hypothetical protein
VIADDSLKMMISSGAGNAQPGDQTLEGKDAV